LEVFSFNYRPRVSPAPTHFIYHEAWAEFDRIESRRERNALSLTLRFVELSFAVASLGAMVFLKHYRWPILVVWTFSLGVRPQVVSAKSIRELAMSALSDKVAGNSSGESKCTSCGLRLHQLEP